ncbi:ComF family protein [Caldifermentibacillus hisashii]|uniref:ComF family protein n=1 Tax=Caldifermentibacillus hisashii TaxID=996558 RepID=UPI0031FBB23B
MQLFKTDLCLLCSSPIAPTINWESLLFGPNQKPICEKCYAQFSPIREPACKICHRSLDKLSPQFHQDGICNDCIKWQQSSKWKNVLEKNTSLFEYNDFMAEVIARFKYRGDYALAKIFSQPLKQLLQNIDYDLLVPIPLSEERLYERGFNQADSLALEAGAEPINLLRRIHSEKQSKKSRNERIHLPQVFQLSQAAPHFQNKHILLIDDVYTTGSTLRQAAVILLQAGAKTVQSLTLARG